MTRRQSAIGWAAIDTLTCLILVIYTMIAPPLHKHSRPAIPTEGVYAVTIDWPADKSDDVDLWVQDPAGNIVYFANPQAGLMNLEHDDTGGVVSEILTWNGKTYRVKGDNHERTVIRQTIPGEYTVNVYMYRKDNDGPVPVTVSLWSLVDIKVVQQRHLVLTRLDQEITAFRFTVDATGHITNIDHTPKCLSCIANSGGG